jgi:hypothetical protein
MDTMWWQKWKPCGGIAHPDIEGSRLLERVVVGWSACPGVPGCRREYANVDLSLNVHEAISKGEYTAQSA